MKSISHLTVRTRISIVFNLLAGIALLMVLAGLVSSLEAWRKASHIIERNAIAADSLAAVKHFAFERGRTNVILRGKTTISESNRKFIDERRRQADTAMASALTAAAGTLPSSTQAVERSWSAIKTLRQEVERDFVQSLEVRDKTLPGRWLPAANALVSNLEALLAEASQIREADFQFAQLTSLRLHALQFRNAVGSESTRLSGEISAGRVPTAALIRDVTQMRGAGQQLWTHIEHEVTRFDDAALNAALDKVHQAYFTDFRPLMDAIIEAAQQNQLPAFTTEQFTQQAVPALDSIIEMVDGLDRAIADYAAQQLRQAQRLLAGALIGLALTLLLVYLGRRVLAQDLILPLQVILDRIHRLRGSTDRMSTLDPGNLANISHALDLLEDALNEVRAARMAAETSRQELDAHRHHLEDIVEARTAELQQERTSLEQRVQERTADLVRSQQSLNEAQRIAQVGNWELDLLTNKLIWSDEIFRIFEIDQTRFGATYEAFLTAIHPKDRDAVNVAYRQSLETRQPYGITHRLQMPDGRIKYVHEQCESFFDADGKPLRSVGTVQDVTERKQAESALAEQQRIVELILEQSLAGYWDWWIQRNEEYLSPTFKKMFGYEDHQMPNTPDAWQKIIFPEDLPGVFEVFNSHVQSHGKLPFYNEVRYQHRDGSTVWVICTGRVIEWDDQGQPVRMIGCHIDITRIKNAEAEIKQLNTDLESRVVERTKELEVARDAAEAANRAKSTFLANMSHELRTPMNAIMGMTDLVLRRTVDPQQIDQLGKVKTASRHLLHVINDILDISKIEAERLQLEHVDFRLGEILENMASLMGHKTSEKGLKLLIDLPKGLPERRFNGDPTRLGQILLNLAGNALKFTVQGAITLRARLIEETPDAVLLRWEVVDTGIGIDADAQKRLFTAFEQADNSMTRKYGGTGLGLAISQRLVKLMGGEIGVESQPGQGSTFWFSVRLGNAREATASAPALPPDSAEARLRTRYAGTRLLLAEDEPVNQEVSRTLLEDAGLVVDVAEDGQQALELARQNHYALILMDMQMPNLNGVEATRAIRADSLNTDTPILAMTANAFDEDRKVCLDAGMNDHIAKPVDPAVLFETLLKWLEKTE